jgi:hypothetical protein
MTTKARVLVGLLVVLLPRVAVAECILVRPSHADGHVWGWDQGNGKGDTSGDRGTRTGEGPLTCSL